MSAKLEMMLQGNNKIQSVVEQNKKEHEKKKEQEDSEYEEDFESEVKQSVGTNMQQSNEMIEELWEVKKDVIDEVNKLITRIVAMEGVVDKVKKSQDEL